MLSTGINTTEQIDKFKYDAANKVEFGSQIYHEFSLKAMIISCFAYGGWERETWNFERYIKPFEAKLGAELFNEVYTEQTTFLVENCSVESGVFTDGEGCSYNSVIVNK